MRVRSRMGAWMAAFMLVLAGTAVPALGSGDYNGDGTIDLADYAEFPGCMAGPGGGVVTGCEVFDFNADSDVDLADFAAFQRVYGKVMIEIVTVGNPNNTPDTRYATPGYGRVDYMYNMGKYEVTAGQYTAFLNAVAATDTYGLYNTNMAYGDSGAGCRIQRGGEPGSYTYSVAAEWAKRPVNYVSWGDTARFANWLHNGQPTGAQDLTTTEDGSYLLNGATGNMALNGVTREADATWVIPSEDEWYKAAYHKNDGVTGNYFDFPTGSDTVASNQLTDPDPGNNATFYNNGFTIGDPYWRTEVGAHENSDSPYGTLDQGGNAREWNEAIVLSSYRVFRGGSFDSSDYTLHASYRNHYLPPVHEYYYLGFRVSKVD